jgi:phosphoribosylanthranilate isomerase
MPLKTLVKVGSITNLSDARYCAGMGVDLLGFQVIETNKNYIAPALYQQIRGWVSGPKIVAEFQGLNNSTDIEGLLNTYMPDYAELTIEGYKLFRNRFNIPVIVNVEAAEVPLAVLESFSDVDYVITGNTFSKEIFKGKVLARGDDKETLKLLLNTSKIDGVALEGSPEIRPGFKNYDNLADILEMLDE